MSRLEKLGIGSNEELLHYYPFRYEDRALKCVCDLHDGDTGVVTGVLQSRLKTHPRPGLYVITAKMVSPEGMQYKAVWFNDNKAHEIPVGTRLCLYGNFRVNQYGVSLTVRDYAQMTDDSLPEGFTGIVPVYSLVQGVTQKTVRTAVKKLFASGVTIEDHMPPELIKKYKLMTLADAVKNVHIPADNATLQAARRRLAYDELFMLQVALRLKTQKAKEGKKQHTYLQGIMQQAVLNLPYKLTNAQSKAWQDIVVDMDRNKPMRRMLLGDVGSGKTVVAALALRKAAESGYTGLMMAPTEPLARQHYETLQRIFKDTGIEVGLATGSIKQFGAKTKVIVGTHALLNAELSSLGHIALVVIDEQHRFGVEQRTELEKRAGYPDLLVMTATPIPRTLAMTAYGDMDLSVIDEVPPGRKPVKTYVTMDKMKALRCVYSEVRKGRQAYVVCPLVEESEVMDLENAVALSAELKELFAQYTVELLHGRMRPQEKEEIMTSFRQRKVNILVSTTVIEVGVDVPNATIMIVIDADRFGLAQLHQLRGRVGRGEYESTCILVSGARTEQARQRLKAMHDYTDGLKLAEIDLDLRGPGEFFGMKQSGMLDFKIASLGNAPMVEAAQKDARAVKITNMLASVVQARFRMKIG